MFIVFGYIGFYLYGSFTAVVITEVIVSYYKCFYKDFVLRNDKIEFLIIDFLTLVTITFAVKTWLINSI